MQPSVHLTSTVLLCCDSIFHHHNKVCGLRLSSLSGNDLIDGGRHDVQRGINHVDGSERGLSTYQKPLSLA